MLHAGTTRTRSWKSCARRAPLPALLGQALLAAPRLPPCFAASGSWHAACLLAARTSRPGSWLWAHLAIARLGLRQCGGGQPLGAGRVRRARPCSCCRVRMPGGQGLYNACKRNCSCTAAWARLSVPMCALVRAYVPACLRAPRSGGRALAASLPPVSVRVCPCAGLLRAGGRKAARPCACACTRPRLPHVHTCA